MKLIIQAKTFSVNFNIPTSSWSPAFFHFSMGKLKKNILSEKSYCSKLKLVFRTTEYLTLYLIIYKIQLFCLSRCIASVNVSIKCRMRCLRFQSLILKDHQKLLTSHDWLFDFPIASKYFLLGWANFWKNVQPASVCFLTRMHKFAILHFFDDIPMEQIRFRRKGDHKENTVFYTQMYQNKTNQKNQSSAIIVKA